MRITIIIDCHRPHLSNMDIGTQIQASVHNPKGAMNKIYQRAKAHIGQAVPFTWNNKAFNSEPSNQLKTVAWPFGRVSGNVKGAMTVNKDGTYVVNGGLHLNSDFFSWVPDEKSWGANEMLRILGNNFNGRGPGNLQHASLTSQYTLNFPYIKPFNFMDTAKGGPPGSVRWSQASPNYQSSGGQMPVNYKRDYNFSAWGSGK